MVGEVFHYTLYFYGLFAAALAALLALLIIIDGLARLIGRLVRQPDPRPFVIDLEDLRPLGNVTRLDRRDG